MHKTGLVKLITGETIICEIAYSEDEKSVSIKNALQLSLNSSESGSSLITSKWMETDKKEFNLKPWHIIVVAEPTEYFKQVYKESLADLEAHSEYTSNDTEDKEIDNYLDRMNTYVPGDENIH